MPIRAPVTRQLLSSGLMINGPISVSGSSFSMPGRREILISMARVWLMIMVKLIDIIIKVTEDSRNSVN